MKRIVFLHESGMVFDWNAVVRALCIKYVCMYAHV